MSTEGPRLSPGKGRWPKSEKKRAHRRYQLKAATAYKGAIADGGGFSRSRGAASKGASIDPNSAEFAEIAARYGNADPGQV